MALERLQILVDGNAQGAIREFEKLGQAADRELGKTDDRLNRISASLTSFGTGLLAGGAVAIGGLKQLADSASAYGEQVSAATVIFGEQGAAQLEKFADAAADTANISKTEATKAANGFASFARQAGLTGTAAVRFSTDLVQLAGDLSSFRDISVEEALQALQSGLAGEGEPIRRLGGNISDVALKAEYLAVTGQEVTGTLTQQQKVVAINSKLFKDFDLAQGDVLRTSDSLAGKTRNAEAEFENLKTELGEGLVPIFATVVGGIGDLVEKFDGLTDSQKDVLGQAAGYGAFASVAVGALSLVAGQAIKFRDAFTSTVTTVVDGVETTNRQLSRLGKVAVGGAVIGSLFALNEALRDAQVNSEQLLETYDNLADARSDEEALEQLLRSTEQLDGWFDDFVEALGPGIGDVLDINGFTVELEDLRESLANLGPEELEKSLSALRNAQVSESLLSSPFALENLQRTIEEYELKLRDAQGAQEETAGGADELGAELDNLNAPVETITTKIQGLTVETTDAATAFEAYIDKLRATTDPFFGVIDAANKLQDANRKALEAFFALADGATTEELEAFADAQRDNVQAALDQEEAIATLRDMVEQGKIGYGDFVDTMNEIVQRNPELLGAVQQVKDEMFFAALAAQGLDQIDPTIEVTAETEQALKELEGVKAALEAMASIFEFVGTIGSVLGSIGNKDLSLPEREVKEFRDLNGNKIIGRSIGGPVNPNQIYMVGEEGPELFRPRTHGSIVPNNRLGGGVNITQNITTPDPLLTAAEVVRRQRDAEFLAGV